METKRNRIGTARQLLTFTAAMLLGGGIFGVTETLAQTPVNVTNTSLVVITPHTSYSNTIGGLLCGTHQQNQCEVPAGKQLVIEHVSGFIFKSAPTAFQNTSTTMAVTDSALGLNGAGFHTFLATKINDPAGGITDVFVFSLPFKMWLSPGAKYYFSSVAGISVSGYLVDVLSNPGVARP